MSSKRQKRQRLIAFIFSNTIQYPCTLKNIYYSNKRGPSPFFHSDTTLVLGHVLVHFVDKTLALVVTVELIQLLLNILSFNFVPTPNKSLRFTRFRSCVNRPAVVLTNHCQSYSFFAEQRFILIFIYEKRKLRNVCSFFNINITISHFISKTGGFAQLKQYLIRSSLSFSRVNDFFSTAACLLILS